MRLAILRSLAILTVLTPLAHGVEENRVVTKRFPLSSGAAPEIVVSVITGGIQVTSHTGSEVILTARVHYEADDAVSLADLQKRVRLESEQSGNNVWIGTESDDWNGGGSRRQREFGWRGKTPPSSPDHGRRWRFRHDIELKVPRTAHLKLSTVNGGEIRVDGVAGEFRLNNVNGGIDVKGADGFGRAHTVNGPVSLAFQKNPSGPLSVKTINGKVHLYLLPGLNADFKIKTFNGKAYSDFDLTSRPLAMDVSVSGNGMKRIRSNRFSGARAGNGGPEIEIDGFNGDIYILEKKH